MHTDLPLLRYQAHVRSCCLRVIETGLSAQVSITLQMVEDADEVFMCGGSVPVHPVTKFNDQPIAEHEEVGIGALSLRNMIIKDMQPPKTRWEVEESPMHDPVPYGVHTGMLSEMP